MKRMLTELDREIVKETTHKRPLLNVLVFLLAVVLLGAWLGYRSKLAIDKKMIETHPLDIVVK